MADTHWNYRIVKTETPEGPEWGIYEVYYSDGDPTMRTVDPITFTSDESADDVRWALEAALRTLAEHGVLDDSVFASEE